MLSSGVVAFAACRNAVRREEVKERFEERARREFVGQQQAWNFVRDVLESYSGAETTPVGRWGSEVRQRSARRREGHPLGAGGTHHW